MKLQRILIIAIATFFLASCSFSKNEKKENSIKEKSSAENTTVELKTGKVNENVIYLTDETFKQKVFNYEINEEWKYEGDVPCIVDFYADWCGPCKMIAPTLEELAKEYDGKIIIYKVDTEKQQEVAQAFGIRSIPSILFVPIKGQPQMAQGALPKESFVSAINEVLLNQKKEI